MGIIRPYNPDRDHTSFRTQLRSYLGVAALAIVALYPSHGDAAKAPNPTEPDVYPIARMSLVNCFQNYADPSVQELQVNTGYENVIQAAETARQHFDELGALAAANEVCTELIRTGALHNGETVDIDAAVLRVSHVQNPGRLTATTHALVWGFDNITIHDGAASEPTGRPVETRIIRDMIAAIG